MSAPTVTVSIGAVRHWAGRGCYRLEWTLLNPDGTKRGKTTTAPRQDDLLRFRLQLIDARDAGLPFDQDTGLPPGVTRPQARRIIQPAAGRPLWQDLRTRVHDRWDKGNRHGERHGNTTKDRLDDALTVALALLAPTAPTLTPAQVKGARAWLRWEFTPEQVRERLAEQERQRHLARRSKPATTGQQRWRRERTDRRRAERERQRQAEALAWEQFFDRYGLRWYQIDEAEVLTAIARLRRNVNGSKAGATAVTSRFVALNEWLNWAVRQGHLRANPLDRLDPEDKPSTTVRVKPVDLRRVLSMGQVVAVVEQVRGLAGDGHQAAARLTAYFAMIALAGVRPAEARGVRVSDCTHLPPTGWGTLVLAGRLAAVGCRYTADGARHEAGPLKWRHEGETRTIPIPPMLVGLLREHINRFALTGDDLLAIGRDGEPASDADIATVWHVVRDTLFAADTHLRTLQAKELRHARASMLVATNEISWQTAANWLGHSIGVLQSVYVGITASPDSFTAESTTYYDQLVPPELRKAGPGAGVNEQLRAERDELRAQNDALLTVLATGLGGAR